MEITDRFRYGLGNFLLNRKIGKSTRKKQVINLEEAKSVVIIYNVTGEERFNIIKKTAKALSNSNRQVMILGYIHGHTIPDYCVAANAGYFFNRKSINWLGLPKSDYLLQFIKKPFDILMDFTTEDFIVTRYLAGLSNARLKTGSFSQSNQTYLDVMIEADPRKSYEYYIEQTLHYLKLLKRY